ncbi:MAG TPA: amidase [Candidatus Limnocylindria bacterium]|nr:amidase [Candidatus Limnocylindria bacterium]
MKERSLTSPDDTRPYHRVIDELALLPMHEAAALLRARRASSVELTRACIERIDRLDSDLVAFITRTADAALADAAAADTDLARGVDHGPLHGMPVALKDLFDVTGVRTTGGSRILADNVPQRSSAVAERLRAAGAVSLGKTNLHEWAFGVTNQNPHFGAAKNPWDPSRIPGGSSGGTAIAVATGMCLMSPGSDTGGSIRIPASLCGVAGLKPTYGRVSLRGVVALSWTLDHAGPLARSVRDLASTLQVLAGYDAEDPGSADTPVDDYLADIESGARGLRVLVPTDHFFTDCDAEVEAAVREAVELLRREGATIVERTPPDLALLAAQRPIISVDAATYHREHLRDRSGDIGADVLERLRYGTTVDALDYARARRDRETIRRSWTRMLREVDVIATPTTRIAAPPREGQDAVAAAARLTANTSPFNLTGLPALSIPCGFTRAGLPIGLQLAAAPWREAVLLRAARAYERATDWNLRHPQG